MKDLMKIFCLIAALALAAPAWAADSGQFTEINGQVSVQKAGGQTVQAVLGTRVAQGDKVMTAKNTKATILFQDGSVLRLGPSTTLGISKLSYQEDKGIAQAAYDLASGTLMCVVGSLFGNPKSEYTVKTPTAVAGVRGTMVILKAGVNPQTNYNTTMAAGIQGSFNFQGFHGGNGVDIGANMFSMTDENGNPIDPSEISMQDLIDLLNSVTVGDLSLGDRAFEIRRRAGSGTGGAYVPFEIVLLPGGNGNDPDNLSGNDNPSDLIYQEPPQATELIITIDVTPPPA
ncbi:MAG TPA: FecR family protein [bacterium]|nr:FecR family protein [bacterium]